MEPMQQVQEDKRQETSHRHRPSKMEDSQARGASLTPLKSQANQSILPVARITTELPMVEIQMATMLLEFRPVSLKTTMKY